MVRSYTVMIRVDPKFYNILENERKRLTNQIRRVTGIDRNRSITTGYVTKLMAENNYIPKINLERFRNVKQKRRHI